MCNLIRQTVYRIDYTDQKMIIMKNGNKIIGKIRFITAFNVSDKATHKITNIDIQFPAEIKR